MSNRDNPVRVLRVNETVKSGVNMEFQGKRGREFIFGATVEDKIYEKPMGVRDLKSVAKGYLGAGINPEQAKSVLVEHGHGL